MKHLLAALLSLCLASAPALAFAAPPALDGTNHAPYTAAATGTVTITTTQTNDVVVVVDAYERNDATDISGTAPTATGLTFAPTPRSHTVSAGNGHFQAVDVWWAPAASIQTANTITVHHPAAAEAASINVFAVHGVNNISSPWDTNGALPNATISNASGVAASSPTYSTTQANDFVFAGGYSGTDLSVETASWTQITSENNGSGAVNYSTLGTFYNTVTATQTAQTVPFTYVGTMNIRFVDVLTADASGGGGSTGTRRTLTGAGK